MIGVEERTPAWQPVFRTVREAAVAGLHGQGPEDRAVRDPAEGDDHGAARECMDFAHEIWVAAAHFVRLRLVAGRQALHGIADAAVEEPQSVARSGRLGARREARVVQRAVKQDSRVVAGKRPARPVGAVHSGGETHHEQARARCADGRDRPAMIIGVLAADDVEKPRESRAAAAAGIERRSRIAARLRARRWRHARYLPAPLPGGIRSATARPGS